MKTLVTLLTESRPQLMRMELPGVNMPNLDDQSREHFNGI